MSDHTDRRPPWPEDLPPNAHARPTQRLRLDDGSALATSTDDIAEGGRAVDHPGSSATSAGSWAQPAPPQESGQSPPRQRQPPLSSTAWSSLRDRLPPLRRSSVPGDGIPQPSRPTLPLPGNLVPANMHAPAPPMTPAGIWPGLASHPAPSGPDAPRRTILPLPRPPTDIFSRLPNTPHPPVARLGDAFRPTGGAPFGGEPARRNTAAPPFGTTLIVPAHLAAPGGTLAALLTDILGLGGRRAAQMEQYRQQTILARAAATAGRNDGSSMPPPAAAPSTPVRRLPGTTADAHAHAHAQAQAHTPTARRDADATQAPSPLPSPAGIGGTSIVVQGAMVSRLQFDSDEEPSGASAPVDVEGDSQSAPSAAQDGQAASHHHSDQPSVPPSQSDQSSIDADSSGSQQSAHASSSDSGTSSTSSGSVRATVNEQATMLTRLLSIAAAATAASLFASAPVEETPVPAANPAQGRQDTTAPPLPSNAAQSPTGSSRSRSGSITSMQSSRSSIFPRVSFPTFLRRSAGNAQPHAGPVTGLRGRLSSLASTFRTLGRGRRTTSDPVSHLDDAASTDGQVSQGSTQTGPQPQENNARMSTDTLPGGMRDTVSSRQQEMSLSEMIHEAIQEGTHERRDDTAPGQHAARPMAAGSGAEGQSDTAQTSGSSSDEAIPLPAHLQNVLRSVRENRLHPGAEGSFESWLTGLGGDLTAAVREMGAGLRNSAATSGTSHQPGPSSTDSSTAPAPSVDSEATPHERPAPPATGMAGPMSDVENGQLSFFRLFRFDGDADLLRDTEGGVGGDAATQTLVPCIAVGVRSQTAHATPDVPNAPADTAPVPSGQQGAPQGHADPTQMNAEGEERAETTPQTEPSGPQVPPEDASEQARTNDNPASRFLILVSGGHYPRSHPLLNSPPQMAAREFLILIEVLANLNGSAAAAAAAAAARKKDQTASKEEIQGSGLRVALWADLKASSVGADAAEGSTTTTTNTKSDSASIHEIPALRAGDRCGICLEEWADADSCRILGCKHVYHTACVDEWLEKSSNTCPMCRVQAVKKAATSRQHGTYAMIP